MFLECINCVDAALTQSMQSKEKQFIQVRNSKRHLKNKMPFLFAVYLSL